MPLDEVSVRRFATTEETLYFLVKDNLTGTVHIGYKDIHGWRGGCYHCGVHPVGNCTKVDPADVLIFFKEMPEKMLAIEIMGQLRHSGKVCKNCVRAFFGKGMNAVEGAEEVPLKLVQRIRGAFPIKFSPEAVGVPKTQLVRKALGDSEDEICFHLQVTYTLRDTELTTITDSISELVEKAREHAEVTARLTTDAPLDVEIDV